MELKGKVFGIICVTIFLSIDMMTFHRTAIAGPCDPALPLPLVIQGVRARFRKAEKLDKKGSRKKVMTDKQKKSLDSQIKKATSLYQERNASLASLSSSNLSTISNIPDIPDSDIPASDVDLPDCNSEFSSDFPSSDVSEVPSSDAPSDFLSSNPSDFPSDVLYPLPYTSANSSTLTKENTQPVHPKKKQRVSQDGKIRSIYRSQNSSVNFEDFDLNAPRITRGKKREMADTET